jgi:preprotein translocase subunit SecG
MQTFLIFFYILTALLLIAFILFQQGKWSDIGSAFGGGSSNTMFGPNSSLSPLTKITAVLSLIFLTLSFYLTFQARSIDQEIIFKEEITKPKEGIVPDSLPE